MKHEAWKSTASNVTESHANSSLIGLDSLTILVILHYGFPYMYPYLFTLRTSDFLKATKETAMFVSLHSRQTS